MIERPFANRARSSAGALSRAAALSPDDAQDLAFETRALLVGRGGDLCVITAKGDDVVLKNLVAGVLYPLAVHRVRATGTTAEDIVGLA